MLENLTAMEMMETMTTVSVEHLFIDSLARYNALPTIVALKVLAKRGEYFRIYSLITGVFFGDKDQGIRLNSGDFCMMLGQGLMELKKADYVLWRIGTKIIARKERYDVSGDPKSTTFTEGELASEFRAAFQLPSPNNDDYDYGESDIKTLNKDHTQNTQYIRDLLALGLKYKEFQLIKSMVVYARLEGINVAQDIEDGMEKWGYDTAGTSWLRRMINSLHVAPEF